MNRTLFIIAIGVILSSALYALFAWQTANAPVMAEQSAEVPYDHQITLSRTFEDGVHTISGTLLLPTPCQDVTTTAALANEVIQLSLSVAEPDGICLERTQEREFSTEIAAEEGTLMRVFVNGAEVAFTIHDTDS